jgi:hypothetical protein
VRCWARAHALLVTLSRKDGSWWWTTYLGLGFRVFPWEAFVRFMQSSSSSSSGTPTLHCLWGGSNYNPRRCARFRFCTACFFFFVSCDYSAPSLRLSPAGPCTCFALFTSSSIMSSCFAVVARRPRPGLSTCSRSLKATDTILASFFPRFSVPSS